MCSHRIAPAVLAAISFSVVAPALTFALPCQAPTGWLQRSQSTAPPARLYPSLAYHEARDRVVLFGGAAGGFTGTMLADTWEWDGRSWIERQPATSPGPLGLHAMAYDAGRQRVVLFGGTDLPRGTPRNDTWEWDGSSWTEVQPASRPPARVANAGMAYDAARQRVVLFGGQNGGALFADTWEWDGVQWTERTPAQSPSARTDIAMAYDSARQRVVLFGGFADASTVLGDTWLWDGTSWTSPAVSQSPRARGWHQMAYDSLRERVVMFGGSTTNGGGSPLGDTWEWDGTSWAQVATTPAPAARASGAMAYLASSRKLLLFGGHDGQTELADTWEYFAASYVSFGRGCPGSRGIPVLSGTPPRLGQVFEITLSNLPPSQPGFLFFGLSRTSLGGIKLPLNMDLWQMPACDLYTSLELTYNYASTAAGTFKLAIPQLPPVPALLGAEFFNQALIVDPWATTPFPVIATNAGAAAIGW